LFLVSCFALTSFAFGKDPITVLTTGDKKETPYAWNQSGCKMGESDLTVYTKSREKKVGQLNFHFRNIVPKLKTGEVVPVVAKDTEILGMTFKDREETLWAFKPSRNGATCQLSVQLKEGVVKLWGHCMGLTDESFAQDFDIAESHALHCTLPNN